MREDRPTGEDLTQRDEVKDLVARALEEDIASGDITTACLVDKDRMVRACIISRGTYVLAGANVADLVFKRVDEDLAVELLAADGAGVASGQTVIAVNGRARSILAAERTALNFLQRLTGIATLTRQFVDQVSAHGVQVLDTRKTTPTLRYLEKYAVRCGGGANHRMGLFDRVLIKDTHRRLWQQTNGDDLAAAVRTARGKCPDVEIEVEVESPAELAQVLEAGPDWVLLDNMTEEALRECVRVCGKRCKLEASGTITLASAEKVAATGVDAISVGSLTHSAPAADFTLEIEE